MREAVLWIRKIETRHNLTTIFSNPIEVWRVIIALSFPDGPANLSAAAAPLLHFSLSQGSSGVLSSGVASWGTLLRGKFSIHRRLHGNITIIYKWAISTCLTSWHQNNVNTYVLTFFLRAHKFYLGANLVLRAKLTEAYAHQSFASATSSLQGGPS
jgi:hypothetical protein